MDLAQPFPKVAKKLKTIFPNKESVQYISEQCQTTKPK
jgi:hypothetical protein